MDTLDYEVLVFFTRLDVQTVLCGNIVSDGEFVLLRERVYYFIGVSK